MRTELDLQQIRQHNTNILALADTSIYNPDLPVENAYLEVYMPNFDKYVQVPYFPGQITLLTTVNLGITSQPTCLYSGLYTIVQTIKPNDQLRKTSYIFNTSNERKKLSEIICQKIKDCEDLSIVYDLHTSLDVIELLAAEGETKKSIQLFNMTCKKINDLCVGCVEQV